MLGLDLLLLGFLGKRLRLLDGFLGFFSQTVGLERHGQDVPDSEYSLNLSPYDDSLDSLLGEDPAPASDRQSRDHGPSAACALDRLAGRLESDRIRIVTLCPEPGPAGP